MSINIARILSIFALLQFTTACTTFTSALDPETKPNPGAGYVYGRFTLNHSSTSPSFVKGHLRMGLVLEEKEKTASYTIQFEQSEPLSVVAVKPGTYALKKVVFATWDYGSAGEKLLRDSSLTKAFVVEPGKAYYVADFVGRTESSSSGNRTSQSWSLESVEDNYNDTTTEFKNKFHNLRQLDFTRAIEFK